MKVMYKIIITAGGTSERIDNVRKITNSSSGKLGSVIASKMLDNMGDKIDKIYYICSKNSIKPVGDKIEIIDILDTYQLEQVVRRLLTEHNIDFFIHSMAVADYTVDFVTTAEDLASSIEENRDNILESICNPILKLTDDKISSYYDNLIIKLKRTPKIISMIKRLSPSTNLVGFKLLDGVSEDELIDVAINLKEKNGCDIVVANDLSNIRSGVHKAFIINGKDDYVVAMGKEDIADKLLKEIMRND